MVVDCGINVIPGMEFQSDIRVFVGSRLGCSVCYDIVSFPRKETLHHIVCHQPSVQMCTSGIHAHLG